MKRHDKMTDLDQFLKSIFITHFEKINNRNRNEFQKINNRNRIANQKNQNEIEMNFKK